MPLLLGRDGRRGDPVGDADCRKQPGRTRGSQNPDGSEFPLDVRKEALVDTI